MTGSWTRSSGKFKYLSYELFTPNIASSSLPENFFDAKVNVNGERATIPERPMQQKHTYLLLAQ